MNLEALLQNSGENIEDAVDQELSTPQVDPMDRPIVDFKTTTEVESPEAMSILEVAASAVDSEAVAKQLQRTVETGGDVNQYLKEVRKVATDGMSQALFGDIDAMISSGMSSEQVVAEVRSANDFLDTYKNQNTLFADPLLGSMSANRRSVSTIMHSRAAGEELNRKVVTELVGEDVVMSEQDMKEWDRGLTDRYLTEIFFIPMFFEAMVDEQSWEENKAEYYAWQAYMEAQTKDSYMYKKGGGGGAVVASIIADPFAGLFKIPVIGWTAVKAAKTMHTLADLVGAPTAIKLISSSQDELIKVLSKDEKLMLRVAEATAGKSDQISRKVQNAVADVVEKKVVTTNVTLRQATSEMAADAQLAVFGGDDIAQDTIKSGVALTNNSAAKELSTTQELLKKAIGAEEALPLTMITGIPNVGILMPQTAYGTALNNAVTISNTVSHSLFYDVMQEAQRRVQLVDTMRIQPVAKVAGERAFNFGLMGEPIHTGVSKLRWVLPGPRKFKNMAYNAYVKYISYNKTAVDQLSKGFSKQLDIVYKGLNKKERTYLDHLVQMADDAEDFGSMVADGIKIGPTTFKTKHYTPKIIDRFRARQMAMQNAQRYLNASVVSQMSGNGFKKFDNKIASPIKARELPNTAKIIDTAGQPVDDLTNVKLYELVDPHAPDEISYLAVSKGEVLSDLDTSINVVGTRAGYMRREYTDKYRVFRITKGSNGKILTTDPIATADTYKEATEFVGRHESENSSLVAVRTSAGTTDFAYNADFMTTLKAMDDTQFDELLESLRQTGGWDETSLSDLVAARDKFGYKRASALLSRTEKGLKSVKGGVAPHLIGEEADEAYLKWLAQYVGEADYITKLEKKFMNSFGDSLKLANPYSEISLTTPLGREAAAYQKQLKVITNRVRNASVAQADDLVQRFADYFIHKEIPGVSKMWEMLDNNLPLPSQMIRGVGKFTSVSAMGTWNLLQIGLQFSAAFLNTTAKLSSHIAFYGNKTATIKAATQAQIDFVNYIGYRMFGAGGDKVPVTSLANFIEESGIITGIEWDDLGRNVNNTRNLRGMSGYVFGALDTVGDASLVFAREGEKFGQIYALLAQRRLLEAQIKAGKHTSLTVSDIGGQRFIEEAFDGAKQLAHNMNRHNAPGMTQGELARQQFKFKDFAIHQASLFFPGGAIGLSKRELIGMYAVWGGLFGPKGIPFVWDAVILGEMIAGLDDPEGGAGKFTIGLAEESANYLADKLEEYGLADIQIPEDIPLIGGAEPFNIDPKEIRLWLEDGLFAAKSDGNVRAATRFAVGEFFGGIVDGAAIDEAVLGAVYTKLKRLLLGDIPDTINNVMAIYHSDAPKDGGTVARALRPLTNQFSGLQNFISGYELIKEPGVIKDKKGRVLLEGATLAEELQRVMGLMPGRAVEEYNHQNILMRQKKVLKKYIWKKSMAIGALAETHPDLVEVELDKLMSELQEQGYTQLFSTIQAIIYGERSFIDKNLSLEERNKLRALEHARATGKFNQTFDRIWNEENK